jgi:hypothetical protein
MKTQDLITAMVSDHRIGLSPGTALLRRLLPAAVIAGAALLATAGLRDDLIAVATTPRVLFKWLLTGSLVWASSGAILRLAQPGRHLGGWSGALFAVILALAIGVTAELLWLPQQQWLAKASGSNATWCLRMIPLLAIAPFAAAFFVLRSAAPTRPVLAGAMAGLMAGAVGAALYSLHCTDDSPLFVATWYGCAILGVSGTGALVGARWLRW